MKKALLLSILILSYVVSFSQQKEKKTVDVLANKHMRKFLDSKNQQKPSILLAPMTVKEDPQQIVLLDSLRKGLVRTQLLRGDLNSTLTNTIPVWSPGNDYVFNMPGTFAYDKNQVKIHIPRFVTVVNRNKEATSEQSIPANKE